MDESSQQGKYISIRIPADELERVDAAAGARGLNRSDYVRSCLKTAPALSSNDELGRMVELLRQLQIGQSAYAQALSRALDLLGEQGGDDTSDESLRATVMTEMARGAELQELLFKAERRTVRLLRQLDRGTR